jgi:ABC-type Fe3+/spermidine/putrescine transport system ATPase subunit
MSRVDVTGVSKRFGGHQALSDVSLGFGDGEFFGLLGPSGSGKTTLLRAIAGFVVPDQGSIAFDGQRVENVPVHRRGIGMVFQSYALFPHLSVAENIGFGLSVRRAERGAIAAKVAEALALVRLPGLGERKPKELSGGQQQRVALARALVTGPRVLLLDEPLGALDRRLRQEMQVELREIQRETGVTAIFVTHDQEEALTLSDRIAIINDGRIVQTGPPRDVYERPATVFAAEFLGDANVFRGEPGGSALRLASGAVIRTETASTGVAIVRPEKITLSGEGENALEGTVMQAIFAGAAVTYRVAVPGLSQPVVAFEQNRSGAAAEAGARVTLRWPAAQTRPVAP